MLYFWKPHCSKVEVYPIKAQPSKYLCSGVYCYDSMYVFLALCTRLYHIYLTMYSIIARTIGTRSIGT